MIAPPEEIELPGARLLHWPHFLAPVDAEDLYQRLRAEVPWQQRTLRMFGRDVLEPRLVSWHGDPGARYRYSGRDHAPEPWTAALQEIRELVAEVTAQPMNSVLANLYRDGSDHMGWHADDEPELGEQPVIASVSLGAVRQMQFRPRPRGHIAARVDLGPGSLFVMAGDTQQRYQHRIPKTARALGARINLTFRTVALSAQDG